MAEHVFTMNDEAFAELEALRKQLGLRKCGDVLQMGGKLLQNICVNMPAEGKKILVEDIATGQIGELDITGWIETAKSSLDELERWFRRQNTEE